MKSGYKFLALTDHLQHSEHNSIYAFLSELSSHKRCESVAVASRGNPQNDHFFYQQQESKLAISEVDKNFTYSDEGIAFTTNLKSSSIQEYDVIILRLPRPIEDQFLHWLKKIAFRKLIINDPIGILNTSNKSFLLNFPELCPPMKMVHSVDEIRNLAARYPIVVKPLKEYGGKGLIRVNQHTVHDGAQNYDIDQYLNENASTYNGHAFLAMKYLKNVNQGDKRILVVDGEIMAASLRLPPDGSWLCNVAQGGKSINAEVDLEEIEIIRQVNPRLKSQGILMYGVDTLVDDSGKRVMSEINTLSIGGFRQAQEQTGIPVIFNTINKIMNYADEYYRY
jgi:glutathione synthase